MALTVILLLCGFAIDSGLLYLAKARISRAVDGAALAAVGNFHQSDDPPTNRNLVATTMRNFAAANYTDLETVGSISGTTLNNVIQTTVNPTTYQYLFFDPTAPLKDKNGAYRKFIQVTLTTGAGGQIVSAECNARCPVHTYFISLFGQFGDLKVSSSAMATRNPRLIMVVVDRSGSMLIPNTAGGSPGADGLPGAIVTFLNFFDTSSDYIGMVSFSSNARLEMPLTTNFLYAATNDLYAAYDNVTNSVAVNGSTTWAVPGPDPESTVDPNYLTSGVRRFRFGGQTAADEGIRLALEQMMANSGWSNPDVVKYMVIFTDGAWNTTRTLVAAPGYTNIVTGPPAGSKTLGVNTTLTLTNATGSSVPASDAYLAVPAMSTWITHQTAVTDTTAAAIDYIPAEHQYDIIQSMGSSNIDATAEGNSYVSSATNGAPHTYVTNTFVENIAGTPYYTTNINVWLPPGSVDYVYRETNTPPGALDPHETTVSEIENPTKTVNITLASGDSNMLVVPGYLIDGIVYDGLDLPYPETDPSYPYMRTDNYLRAWMWPDVSPAGSTGVTSAMRELMFRNYMNLLTGFYVFRPDDPLGWGTEPLTGAPRPLNPVGPYYPSAAFYWPFGSSTAPVGLDQWPCFALIDPTKPDPSPDGMSRAIAYSINMLSTNAAPEWSGELFYKGQNAKLSGATSQSTLLTSKSDWQTGMPSWITTYFDQSGENITELDSAHNTNQLANAVVWRPSTFNGSNNLVSGGISSVSPKDNNNYTGGYVQDGAGNIYRNTMAWSGRPTHYYDFSRSTWVPIGTNHTTGVQMLPLGNWKASEYCWHARAAGVTIYTVGYGTDVTDDEQVFLATLANATNTSAGGGTNFLPQNYNTQQPIGQQFYATTPTQIGDDFSSVAKAINAALTQ